MIISGRDDGPMGKEENIKAFLRKYGMRREDLVLAEQVHGSSVAVVEEKDRGGVIKNVDGLITKESHLSLGVTVADCLPVSFFSDKVSGILHAGWKGIRKGIIEAALEKISEMGEDRENVFFEIGPGIGACHFEIKEDVAREFDNFKDLIYRKEGKMFLDIKKVVERKIRDGGGERVRISSDCTYCISRKYFSFRRDKEVRSMLALNYSLK